MKKNLKIWDRVRKYTNEWCKIYLVWTDRKWEVCLVDMPSRVF